MSKAGGEGRIEPKTTAYEPKNARIPWLIKRIRHALAGARAYPFGVHFGVHSPCAASATALSTKPLDAIARRDD